jgi:hypothetical protein
MIIFEIAREPLQSQWDSGFDISKIMFEGTAEELKETKSYSASRILYTITTLPK